MEISHLDYKLPEHLIAQEPAAERDHSRLLILHRESGGLEHRIFHELPALLAPGDLLVLNNSRVLPARLLGRRAATGGKFEGLFLRQQGPEAWEMLCQTRGRPHPGEEIAIEPGPLRLTLLDHIGPGRWLVRPSEAGSPPDVLTRYGKIPLPPYIRKGCAGPADPERYQTVYAQPPGSVAAPTAGLHFTPAVFEALRQRGIDWVFVTLHVGLGTFQPIQVEDVSQHPMHSEWGELSAETVAAVKACKERGGRVVAVGTTSVRVLETVAATGPLRPWSGETNLFIRPPYTFQVVDALVTNFHLPRTTLLLLIAAFAGIEKVRAAYDAAVAEKYRFYSYGDAMLIV
jgi:S-adenosylmethionine:tRNA ribosyltransferase-isomerase